MIDENAWPLRHELSDALKRDVAMTLGVNPNDVDDAERWIDHASDSLVFRLHDRKCFVPFPIVARLDPPPAPPEPFQIFADVAMVLHENRKARDREHDRIARDAVL